MMYAVSYYARREFGKGQIELLHRVGVIRAKNHDEALGKAVKKCYEIYPPKEGWVAQDALVIEANKETD